MGRGSMLALAMALLACAPGALDAQEPASPGRVAGEAAADALPRPLGWMGRGLLGGLVAGPVGAGVAVVLAGRSEAAPPAGHPVAADEAAFAREYQEGFQTRLRSRRRESALIGGIAGTGVFLVGILVLMDVNDKGGQMGTPSPDSPGFGLLPR